MLKKFKTYELSVRLYKACVTIPCPHYIKDQLRRASLSVVLNTAEGSAKPTEKERKRFYSIALASLRETQALLDILERREEFGLADQVGGCLYRLSH